MTLHGLKVDLEDWHQLLHRRVTGGVRPPTQHVIADTHRLLDLLDERGTRATFFVLGAVAESYPELVREVARRGHEIGSHTYAHELIYRQQPDEFRADVSRSRRQLQDLTGQPVLGFRAPEFSVGHLGHWAFGVLAETGFAYDSSVFPIGGARYGIPDAPQSPFPIETPAGPILEFPLATWDVRRRRLPVAGGSYYRLMPRRVLRRALEQIERARRPAVLYFHPYEFHRGWLYLSGLSWRQRLNAAHLRFGVLHNVATGAVSGRLRSLLAEFKFAPLRELYREHTVTAGVPAVSLAVSPTNDSRYS
jgi:polysaccharide deacetylase family protein (PEP-CTERM system associated)